MTQSQDPKPLPCGNHRLVCACICGRRVPDRELVELIAPPACPACGLSVRVWLVYRIGWFSHLRAWFDLYRWKKRRARLYDHG